jgi:large subunit ribosomal protein L21|tara:strand:+ start:573 stop:1157 length:585 start_codon:yes stop_codon:yes gene_type:complete
MYAIIETGGKQYKVQKNDILAVEKLSAKGGDKVQFNTVLLTGGEQVKVGDPLVKGAGVQATVIDQIKDKKVISFVKRRRKSSSKSKKGHRQQITLLKITDILESGADKTNIQEAKSGKGLKIDYSAKVNISNKAEKVIESVKAKPAKKTPVKKEPKAQKETKAVKTASVAADKKKKDTTKKSTAVKKEVKKKST